MGVSDQILVRRYLSESAVASQQFADDEDAQRAQIAISKVISDALEKSNKLLVAGNGGSAADAQHIAGEFLSRLFFDRRPLAAIALTTDSSVLTAVGNDYGYEILFERQIRALGRVGDVFLAISTSGQSPNVLRALEAARDIGLTNVGFTGRDGNTMDEFCEYVLRAPSSKTSIIQQIHITAAHVICGLVEQRLCGDQTCL